MAEYAVLHASTVRLRSLINRMESNERNMEADRAANLAILEVRSKRRAWSSRALHGRAEVPFAGLGTPLRSSPLVYCSVLTPETMRARASLKYSMGVPRMPGGRVGSTRMSIARERGISSTPTGSVAELHAPTPQGGFIPFPQTETGDDFCSTGPQDTLPLFGGPTEEFVETSPSNSYDNLPELLANMEVAMAECASEADEFGALSLEPPAVPFHRYDEQFADAADEKQEFTLALDAKPPSIRRHSRTKAKYSAPPWISDAIPEGL